MSATRPHAVPGPDAGGGGGTGRRWLLAIGATPLLVGLIAAAVYMVGPSEPTVGLTPPPGYQAIADAYWAYAIPKAWTQDSAYTDSNGDFYYQGRNGWVGETLRIRDRAPTLGEAPPATLESFGQLRPARYTLRGGTATAVPGADAAFSYRLVRGSTVSGVVDAWLKGSRTEIWLLVDADPTVRSTILSSLRG